MLLRGGLKVPFDQHMVCYDLHDEGASKISIRIIINVFFNNIRKHLIDLVKLTCCERFQKAKAELALINWMNTFTYMIFNEMPACVINTALFWINTTKEGYNFNLTPSTLWQLWHKMFYYIFFDFCTRKTSQ